MKISKTGKNIHTNKKDKKLVKKQHIFQQSELANYDF